ncbi:MAG TPA: recombinase family protein [Chloroflexota bacterium]
MSILPPASSAGPIVQADLRSEKIRSWHQDRLAIVYVRQSTPQQVLNHQESARLQYGLATSARALGWSDSQILVIDDDTGQSGASAEQRTGFQHLVSEVSLDHVGIILGVEMSRLARSNKDWHQLLELCALFRTLIADLDGIYDPAHYNDRLLLGLKGTMSEAELHILRQRLHLGCLTKARRGELHFALPVGYVWGDDGQIQFDPDEQAQEVVHLIFRTFEDQGTIGAVVRYLAQHQVQIGVRVREGPGKGQLVWRRPNRMTIQNILKHPLYAGAYVYGRRQHDPRRARAGRPNSGRVTMAPAEWHAFLLDHAPAYLSWEQYERNQARLAANRARAEAMGAVRAGAALLAGLVVCARCGRRLQVHHNRQNHHRYQCMQLRSNYGEPLCQGIAGPCLDTYVSEQVLQALEPAALELSLLATERVEQERAALDRLWQQRRERAAYEADRAARQYHACEPENRLVARTLEGAWNQKLVEQQRLEEEYHRFCRQQPRLLSAEERDAIRQLATNIPALWTAESTTPIDRKEIIRQVVDRVTVDAQGATEQVTVRIEWAGGGQTDGVVTRPIAKLRDLSTYAELCDRVTALTHAGMTAPAIAEQLTEEGYSHPHAGGRFGEAGMRDLQRELGLRPDRPFARPREGLRPDEWWPVDMIRVLEIPQSTLYNWIRRGIVRARQLDRRTGRWVVMATKEELAQLHQRHREGRAGAMRHRWAGDTAVPASSAYAQERSMSGDDRSLQ